MKLLAYVVEAAFPVMSQERDPHTDAYVNIRPSRGLSTEEAEFRLKRFGRNELPRPSPSLKQRLAELFRSHHEHERLINSAAVCRDGAFVRLAEVLLVPGDLVRLSAGDLVPADCMVNPPENADDGGASQLLLDESALTGESLPVPRAAFQPVYKVRALVFSFTKLFLLISVRVRSCCEARPWSPSSALASIRSVDALPHRSLRTMASHSVLNAMQVCGITQNAIQCTTVSASAPA